MDQMSPLDWARRPLQRYAQFSGRAPRAEYWWFYLGYIVSYLIASIIDSMIGWPVVTLLLIVGLFIPMIAAGVRRLHDTGRTGFWLLAPVVPYILMAIFGGATLFGGGDVGGATMGIVMIFMALAVLLGILVFVFTVLPGTKGANRYGPDPYGQDDLQQVFA